MRKVLKNGISILSKINSILTELVKNGQKSGLRYFCQIGKLSKNLEAKNSKIVKKNCLILGVTATPENCQKKFTAIPENCQKEIMAHSHTGKLSSCILK